MCMVEDLYDVSYFQKDRIEVRVNDELTMSFWFKKDLGCYACMFDDELLLKLREHETRFKYCNITIVADREREHSAKEVTAARMARMMKRRLY